MPILSTKNQYLGVNAHLNSFLQSTEGNWKGFHSNYIVNLAAILNQDLPAEYEAHIKRSLLTDHMRDDIDPDLFWSAVVIFKIIDGSVEQFILRIELLSPANNLPEQNHEFYRHKRNAALSSSLPLIEIDFLHQSPPVLKNIPSYADHEPNAHPYSITVSAPRPSLQTGLAHYHFFSVDTPIPLVDIPLDHDEALKQFDFGKVYDTMFDRMRPYHRHADYEQLPVAFETYSEDDQQRIYRRMYTIRRAVEAGVDLNQNAPLPLIAANQ